MGMEHFLKMFSVEEKKKKQKEFCEKMQLNYLLFQVH